MHDLQCIEVLGLHHDGLGLSLLDVLLVAVGVGPVDLVALEQQVLWFTPVQLPFTLQFVVSKIALRGDHDLALVVAWVVDHTDGVVGYQGVVDCTAIALDALRHVLAAETVQIAVFYLAFWVSTQDHRSVELGVLVRKTAVSYGTLVHFEAFVVFLAEAFCVALYLGKLLGLMFLLDSFLLFLFNLQLDLVINSDAISLDYT